MLFPCSIETTHFVNWLYYSGEADVAALIAKARADAAEESERSADEEEEDEERIEGEELLADCLVDALREILEDALRASCPAWPMEIVSPPVRPIDSHLEHEDYTGSSLVLPLLLESTSRIDLPTVAALLLNGDEEPDGWPGASPSQN
jgi:hypothetical protein